MKITIYRLLIRKKCIKNKTNYIKSYPEKCTKLLAYKKVYRIKRYRKTENL